MSELALPFGELAGYRIEITHQTGLCAIGGPATDRPCLSACKGWAPLRMDDLGHSVPKMAATIQILLVQARVPHRHQGCGSPTLPGKGNHIWSSALGNK